MRMLNKVVQRPLLVTRKATAPSAVMRSRQEKRSKGTGLYKRGGVVLAIWNYFRIILLRLGTKWRMTTTARLLRGKGMHGMAEVVGGSGIVQQILCTAAMHAPNNIIV